MSMRFETACQGITYDKLVEVAERLPYVRLMERVHSELSLPVLEIVCMEKSALLELDARKDVSFQQIDDLLDNLPEGVKYQPGIDSVKEIERLSEPAYAYMKEQLGISSDLGMATVAELGFVSTSYRGAPVQIPTVVCYGLQNQRMVTESIDHVVELAGGTNCSLIGWIDDDTSSAADTYDQLAELLITGEVSSSD